MNTWHKILSLILLGIIAFSCSEEGSDPLPDDKETIQLQKLTTTWHPVIIMRDAEDVTDRFTGFRITFTQQKTYTTTPSRGDFDVEPFGASGTWDFKDDNLNIITRDDGVDMNVSVTDTELTLQFQVANSNGRTLGIVKHAFELTLRR